MSSTTPSKPAPSLNKRKNNTTHHHNNTTHHHTTMPPLFGKLQYKWMIVGLVLMIIGFALMAGGKSNDIHQFNYNEVYSFVRITLAPILILFGLAVEMVAIFKKNK